MTASVSLAARLDLTQARPLAESILAHAGQDLTIDAGAVEHLGALPAQVLLAAAQDWERSGNSRTIAPRSGAFDDALAAMGLADRLAMGTQQ